MKDFLLFLEKRKEILNIERTLYSFGPELSLSIGLIITIMMAVVTMDVNLIGHKSSSVFDLWTIQHILSGIGMSGIVISIKGNSEEGSLLSCCVIILLWEIIETYIEVGLIFPYLQVWFDGVEHITNRILGDSLALVIGFIIAKRFPSACWYARILSTVFLAYMASMPTCMPF